MKRSHLIATALAVAGVFGGGLWVHERVQKAGTRAKDAFSSLSGHTEGSRRADARSGTSSSVRRRGPVPDGALEKDLGEGEFIEVSASELGLPDSLAKNYQSAFYFNGARNEDPAADSGPGAPGAPAGRLTEDQMAQKEELLLEHFPELRGKVEKARADRKKTAELFKARGNVGPEQWALENGVRLEE